MLSKQESMAALLRSSCRIGTCMEIVARVLSTVHLKERCRCCPVSHGRQMSFTPERTGVHRNLQIKSTKQHKYDLEHKKRSPRRLEAECPEILIENLVTNLKKNLNQQLWNVSYESVLAIVMDLKNKVVEDNRTFKLSAKSGKELLDMITTTLYLSTVEKSTLTGLIWQIINSIPDFEFAESHFTSYVMACSESNIQIGISDLRQKMADSGLKSGEEFLKAVLCYHCSNGELDTGCKILQEMKDAGMTINGQCFKYLVTAYTKTGSVSTEDMLSIMRKHNIKQDIDTYDAMVQFHAALGDMEAIEKTLQTFKEEYFATEEDKIIVKLQILLPLLQNKFQEQADQAISSFDVLVHPSIKLNDAIEMCAKCLLQNGYVEEAFLVFCIPNKRGRSFVHCFHASEEAKKADSIVKGVKLSVRLLQESRINLRKLFMDSSSSSLAFLTRLMKELKEKNFVKDSQVLRNSTLATCLRSPWKDLVLKLADMDLATLENWADKELARHIEDPLYGTHTDCVNRILEKTLYQDEAAALDMYRKLVNEDSDDPRLPAVKSSGAAHIHSMYLQLGKYSESLHYLKEMIGLNPRYTGHLTKVVSSASVMLSNGSKDGVMESIEYYLRYMDKAFGKISLPAALPNILMQLLPPAQAFACLEKFNVHVNLKDNQFITLEMMRLYVMGNDVDLLATAYIAFLKLDKKPTYQAGVDVILRLIKEDRKDLIQKVLIEMTLLMEQPLATFCYMVALLLNEDIDDARKLYQKNPTFLKTVLTTNSIAVQRLLLNLFNKPKLIDILLDFVVESEDTEAEIYFENNLSAALQNFKHLRKAQSFSTLLQFCSQNPNTSLATCMISVTAQLPHLRMHMQKFL